ncbi:MAG: hypothetical protein ACLU3U_11355 [Gallintestinimicrobium sp.]
MMTIDQILTKLDHYYKEDQLTEVEPFLLSCLEDAKKRAGVWHLYFRRQRASGLLQKHRTV